MALTKIQPTQPPTINIRVWMAGQFQTVALSVNSVINLLEALGDKPINVGAPNSGGAGQRALTIDN
jgi:hypothetical protein